MRMLVCAAVLFAACGPLAAAEISSVYTDLDLDKGCSTFSLNEEGGEFANLACNGWGGYPVLIYSGDLRESIFYGFPPSGNPVWESFNGFNSSGPKIEWRLEKDGDRTVPFATIHRWKISDSDDGTKTTEVLVVEKVGQVDARDGCAVGLVLATGNPKANEMARKIADEQARDFACGADERVIVGDPMPTFSRQEN